MYDAIADPYCYPRSTVLKNIRGLTRESDLARFEKAASASRADEALPDGRLSVRHYRAIHRHLFQDVFSWAGHFRIVRIGKGSSMFCYPENIPGQMHALFRRLRAERFLRGLTTEEFAMGGASFLATLNAIHPFRDGNGRTQMAFMALLGRGAGHPFFMARLAKQPFLRAMIESFNGNETGLRREIVNLIG